MMNCKFLYPVFANSWLDEHCNNVWFYSDPHFGDSEMAALRGITDEEQVRRINSKVGRHDVLVILGDVGDLTLVPKLRGYKILVLGNHDKGASKYQKTYFFRTATGIATFESPADAWSLIHGDVIIDNLKTEDTGLFDEVYEGAVMINSKIILSHQPITNLPPFLFNIHGHDHSNWFTGSRHMNVCAEHINYTPVSLTEIIKGGLLADIESIHRLQIDATIAKKKGNH